MVCQQWGGRGMAMATGNGNGNDNGMNGNGNGNGNDKGNKANQAKSEIVTLKRNNSSQIKIRQPDSIE